jgi:hypothetical protein
MATRKFILSIGQSNAGARAEYAAWGLVHSGLYVDYFAFSPNAAKGYTDSITLPGTWPEHPSISIKGSAVDAIRYLTFYNPGATGFAYLSFPHTMRVTAVQGQSTTGTALKTSLKWQYNPVGQTIVRKRTGTTHTIPALSWGGLIGASQQDEFICTPAFDPPPEVGEELTYEVRAGVNSPSTDTVVFDARFGDDFGTDGSWNGSLAGIRVRCAFSTHPGNVGQIRYVSSITLDAGLPCDVAGGTTPSVKMTFSEAWPNHPNDGDKFVLEPPPVGDVSVPWEKWSYFLPWCPIEGRAVLATITASAVASAAGGAQSQFTVPSGHGVLAGSFVNVRGQSAYQGNWLVTAVSATTITLGVAYSVALSTTTYLRPMGKVNPYPPGFNYPNHVDKPVLYQPFVGETYMYGPSAFALSARAAYHVGLANRVQERIGERLHVISLAIDGSTIGQNDLYAGADLAVGWYDPNQQLSWAPGDRNNIFGRLQDTLDAARLAALREGDDLECVGVFFIQGEGDAVFEDFSLRYAKNLATLKTSVRQAIVNAGMFSGTYDAIPWVQPQISGTSMAVPWPYQTRVNEAIVAVANDDPYMRTFSMTDATKIAGDEAHYNYLGITLLEYRCFQAWDDIYNSSEPPYAELWNAVLSDYDLDGLVTLTNTRDRSATTIDHQAGRRAAQAVIDLFPVYAQAEFDYSNPQHVEAGELGVIAMLWRRGGSASAIENVKWESVFGDDGLISRIRKTQPRSRIRPTSNSGTQQSSELNSDGSKVYGWSDPAGMPAGWLTLPKSVED